MDHPYGKQYGQEGNPRAYMTMRDYRTLPFQWGNQQPVGRNPNPPRSMREYRDQWMSAPVYHVPSAYPPPPQNDYPQPPFYASPPQSPQSPQPLQSIHPLEQAMLDLNRIMDDYMETNKKIKAHSIVTVEDNLNKRLDGLNIDFEHKRDNLQDSSEDLIDQQQCPPEEECLNGTIVEESCLQQPQQGLVENSESLEIGVVVCLWEKEDAIPLLLTEEAVEENKENIFPLPPTDSVYILPLPAPQSQPKTSLPVAPSDNLVYIQPQPAANSNPAAPAPKGKSNPLHAMQNIKRLVASVHTLATTSKKMANAYIAWHSGWFGCGFGFGAPGPRHF